MSKKSNITADFARKVLSYNPETGVLTWKKRPVDMFASKGAANYWNETYAGNEAGSLLGDNANGKDERYRYVTIRCRQYRAQRLIWLIYYGVWPKNVIDHKDGDRQNNRIDNLRDVTLSQNSRNQALSRKNTSGVTGVYWSKGDKKWRAQIKIKKKCHYLGMFDQFDDAVAVRKKAEKRFGFSESHGKRK